MTLLPKNVNWEKDLSRGGMDSPRDVTISGERILEGGKRDINVIETCLFFLRLHSLHHHRYHCRILINTTHILIGKYACCLFFGYIIHISGNERWKEINGSPISFHLLESLTRPNGIVSIQQLCTIEKQISDGKKLIITLCNLLYRKQSQMCLPLEFLRLEVVCRAR